MQTIRSGNFQTLFVEKNDALFSNTITTAAVTNCEIAASTLQNEFVKAIVAQLALEASVRAIRDTFEASRMLALVGFPEVVEDLIDAALSLGSLYVWFGVSLDDFFGPLNEAVLSYSLAFTLLPGYAADVAELCFAVASTLHG